MATLTYPGVYIEEVGSGQHSITGVATSIAVFIGYSNVGPVDEAVMVESWTQYESLYGGMIPGVYLGYAVYQFFLNGGSQAYIVRLCHTDAKPASATIGGLQIDANNPGAWGNNIAVAITGINAVNSTFNLQVYELTGTGSLSLVESYSNLSTSPTNASYAVTIVNNDSNYISLVAPVPPATFTLPTSSAGYDPVYTVSGTFPAGSISVGDTVTQSGAGAATANVLVAPKTTTTTSPTTVMTVQVKGGTVDLTNPTATWSDGANTFAQTGVPTQMPMALVSGSITGGPFLTGETVTQLQSGASQPTAICVGATGGTPPAGLATPGLLLLQYITGAPANSFTQWKGGASGAVMTPIGAPVPTFAMPFAVEAGFLAGTDGTTLKPDDGTSAYFLTQLLNTQAPPAPLTGISLLAKIPIFNLLCVPGESALAAVSALQAFCAANRAFLIVDAPASAVVGSGTNGLSATGPADSTGASLVNSSAANSAYYFPWIQAPDPAAGFRPAYFPPCGFVAGIYATTDATRGVWKAPAGIDAALTGVSGPQFVLNDMQNGSVNTLGVNCVRQFPNFGTVIWGARTIAGNDAIGSEWKYIPIRRLALFLESSLYNGTQWAVFEPNAEPLWGQVRLAIGSFMQSLFLQGAFAGTTSSQAYFVKCDGDNNPPASQALGILNVSVGFAPLYPAEFVVIQIQQMMSQS
jgi:phage tail sheath protein FI